jgi:histidinol-phosphate phosphatase family protein
MELSRVPVALLAGGLGTRLRSAISDRPKVLAQIGTRPFLAYLLDQVAASGCSSVVLCTGYLGEQIESVFGRNYNGLQITYSREPEPLGTGGALRLALPQLDSDWVLVMNGDSYCRIDLSDFWHWHCQRRASASIALARVMCSERYGVVDLDTAARVIAFSEKKNTGPGWINAGIYFLRRELIESVPPGTTVSLEREIFPHWIERNFYGYRAPGPFLDIGTPEDLATAENFFARLRDPRPRRFIVLDRDGTIIEEREYLSRPEDVALIPGAAEALREFQRMGFGLAVITNQSGVGRGYFDLAQVKLVHERLERLLASEGVKLDAFYVCPHRPDDACDCRKPGIGLMQQASSELNFSFEESIVIGDKPCDIDMGRMAGATTFLVRTGYGAQHENAVAADFVVDDLSAATALIRNLARKERTKTHGH